MRNGFRQSMAWLHTWCGLLGGWILFAVFLTGTASYFRQEISAWMRPEMRQAASRDRAVAEAVQYLGERAPTARTWFIELPDGRNRALRVAFSDRDGPGGFTQASLDASGEEQRAVRKTAGGDLFYYFHFDLLVVPFRLGRWLVCLCALGMLVAILTGVVVHRRIFLDFFTFRPRASAQRAWLDGHNLLAVIALPYHLMITYTGLVTFALMLMPWGATLVYGSVGKLQAEIYGQALPPPRAGGLVPLTPLPPLIDAATRRWDGGALSRITVLNPGDASSRVVITRGETDRVSYVRDTAVFDGVTGRLLGVQTGDGPAEASWGALYGLHLARFAGPGLRALFFVSGLAGTGMVATGLLLWVAKRRREAHRGVRFAERLNIGVIAGLPVAMLALFWANRLLPAGLEARDTWEFRSFFGTWLLMLLYPVIRPPRMAWREAFGLAAVLGGLLPLLNAWTTPVGLAVTLRQGDWALAGFDLTMLALAPVLAALAWQAGRARDTARRSRVVAAGLEPS